jgi:DHA1 family multidrug resistance protein-like MFS transporter
MLDRLPPVSPSPSSWSRTLWLMAGVQFIMGASTTIQSPIIPLFLPEIGVTQGGQVEFWSGVLNSVNFLVAAFASPLWGMVADRYGRKVMVVRSTLAICVFMALMGMSQALWQLIALRGLMGAFSGFSAASIALIATQVPENRLGYALGWLSTSQLVGSLLGPVVGGLVADATGSYRVTFFCTSALAGLAAFVAWSSVKEQFIRSALKGKPSVLQGFRTLFSTSGLVPLFCVLLFAQFGIRAVQPVVTLFVQDLIGPVPALATLAGFAFSITGLADVLASPFLGKRSDRIGYRRVLLISLLGAAVASVPQAFVSEYWQFVALRFAAGIFLGGLLPTANALIARLVRPEERGFVFGTTATATFLGSCLGPLTGGTIAALYSIRAVFIVAGLFFLVNFVSVYRVVPSRVPDRTDAGASGEPPILIDDDAVVSSDSDAIVEIERGSDANR